MYDLFEQNKNQAGVGVTNKGNTGWGVKPLDGEQCWINLQCTEADSFLQVSKPWNYMMFSPNE